MVWFCAQNRRMMFVFFLGVSSSSWDFGIQQFENSLSCSKAKRKTLPHSGSNSQKTFRNVHHNNAIKLACQFNILAKQNGPYQYWRACYALDSLNNALLNRYFKKGGYVRGGALVDQACKTCRNDSTLEALDCVGLMGITVAPKCRILSLPFFCSKPWKKTVGSNENLKGIPTSTLLHSPLFPTKK